MTDSATPTLRDILVGYFNDNSDEASDAMGGSSLWGYTSSWGATKGTYYPSAFEGFAKHHGIDKPEVVDNFGGEDMGSDYFAVHKFTRGDETVFIKFYGYYASYDGSTYEGFNVVTPKEKTVVVYD